MGIPTAWELAKKGYHVIVPHFDECVPREKCGMFGRQLRNYWESASPEHAKGREQQINDILKWSGQDKFSVLLGHSWGALIAGRYTHDNPTKVDRLVVNAAG